MHVVFVAGTGRCGSTVFELAMAQALGVPSTGELVSVWTRGILEDRRCSCGERFSGCSFWQGVVETDPPAFTATIAERVAAQTRHVLGAFGPLRCFTAPQRRRLESLVGPEWMRSMQSLYGGVAVAVGSQIFTDSSKAPVLAVLLSGIDGIHLDVVHLVRDPRSVARSWCRPHTVPTDVAPMPRRAAWRSGVVWSLINAAAVRARPALSGSYALVRYEDFVRAPAAVIDGTRSQLGLRPAGIPQASTAPGRATVQHDGTERSVILESPGHSMSGNPPVRFSRQPLTVDVQPALPGSRVDDLTVSILAAPLLRRFGYRFVPAAQP